MSFQSKSENSWNTVTKKKENKNTDKNNILFFKKIKQELDNEFSFMEKKNKKILKKKNEKGNLPPNIFTLLIDDSE